MPIYISHSSQTTRFPRNSVHVPRNSEYFPLNLLHVSPKFRFIRLRDNNFLSAAHLHDQIILFMSPFLHHTDIDSIRPMHPQKTESLKTFHPRTKPSRYQTLTAFCQHDIGHVLCRFQIDNLAGCMNNDVAITKRSEGDMPFR